MTPPYTPTTTRDYLARQFRRLGNALLNRNRDTFVAGVVKHFNEARIDEAIDQLNTCSSVNTLFDVSDAVIDHHQADQPRLLQLIDTIQHHDVETSVNVQIFVAGILPALGQPLAAYDLLATIQQKGPPSLRDSLANFSSKLKPRQLNGQPLDGYDTPPLVILDPAVNVATVEEWHDRFPSGKIVAWNENVLPHLDCSTVQLTTLDTLVNAHPDELSTVVHNVDTFAEDFCSALEDVFDGSPTTRAFFDCQRSALRASVRKPLMKHALQAWMVRTVLKHNPTVPIVMILASHTFLTHLRSCRDWTSRPEQVSFLVCGRSRVARTEIHDTLDQIDAHGVWPLEPPKSPQFSSADITRVADLLTDSYTAVEMPAHPTTTTNRCIFFVRWASKSVAKTMEPVLRSAPPEVDTVVVSLDGETTQKKLSQYIDSITATGTKSQLSLRSATHPKPPLAREEAALLTARIWELCRRSEALTADGFDLVAHAYNEVFRFSRTRLWVLIGIHRLMSSLIDGAKQAIAVVVPGASGGSRLIAAQNAARLRDCRSIDLQHAYMSSPESTQQLLATKYYYAAPHGDLVTAIDQWSSELFLKHFSVQPEAIRTIGTPLYDREPNHPEESHKPTPTRDTNLRLSVPEQPMVLLAAQPGYAQQYLRLLGLLATASLASGPINVVVKLHPHESDTTVNVFTTHVKGTPRNAIHVVRDFNIRVLIQQAEVVITIFSNVGIEAALEGKKLVVANLEQHGLPLPLDKFAVGLNATTESELFDALNGLLLNNNAVSTLNERRRQFFASNPHLKAGNSTERLWSLIQEDLVTPKTISGDS